MVVHLPERALDTTGTYSLPPLAPSSEHDDASYSHVDGLALTAKNLRAAAKAPQP